MCYNANKEKVLMFYLFFSLLVVLIIGTSAVFTFIPKLNTLKSNKVINKSLKIGVIVFCALFILSNFLPDITNLCYSREELLLTPVDSNLALIKWFASASFVLLPLAVFYDNRTVRNLAIFFSLLAGFLQIVFYPQFLELFTSENGRGLNSIKVLSDSFKKFMINPTFRSIYFGVTVGLQIVIPMVLVISKKHIFNVKSLKEWGWFLLIGIITFASSVPITSLQHLFGHTDIIFTAWSIPHLIWLLLVVGQIVCLYLLLKNKEYKIKRIAMFILALSLLSQYSQIFGVISISVKSIPLQLCNIGTFFVVISLVTKNKKIFDFTVIVNLVGAMFALAVPELKDEGLFYVYNIYFCAEHGNVLIVPILCLMLKLFGRIDRKSLKNFLIGFNLYFFSVMALGIIANAIATKTGNDFWRANWFFMFDRETAADLIPFLGNLFNAQIHIGVVTLYPVAKLIIYGVFSAVCFLAFGIIQLIYFISGKIKRKGDKTQSQETQKLNS